MCLSVVQWTWAVPDSAVLSLSVVVVVDIVEVVEVVDVVHAAQVCGGHSAEGPRLQAVTVVQGLGRRGPVGEAWGPQVQFGDTREGNWGEVGLQFVECLLGGGGLAHLGQAVEVELVGIALAVHLAHDVLVVVVPQRPAQLVVVHAGFTLPLPPASGYLVRVQ